ncbi:hypothetical protein [Sphingomonas sp. Leaf38]|uniref:hypothetical protein n=1 Tax=Sphingomonas sp. Leaf38 TaxID=1736217 RepID=UPI0012E270C6|nr:hypothetical protein [Sphingomonas sp. Leaf38]
MTSGDWLYWGGLVIFIVISATLVIVKAVRTRRAIDAFDGDDIEYLKIGVPDWQVPAVKKRTAKLGWVAVGADDAESDAKYVMFKREGADAAPLSIVLHRLHRAGFDCRPMRIEPNSSEITA